MRILIAALAAVLLVAACKPLNFKPSSHPYSKDTVERSGGADESGPSE